MNMNNHISAVKIIVNIVYTFLVFCPVFLSLLDSNSVAASYLSDKWAVFTYIGLMSFFSLLLAKFFPRLFSIEEPDEDILSKKQP